MSSESFVIGQRWISSTEKELGLGVVTEARDRRVTVSFPACGEQRTYADNSAPLTRVRYDVGDTVHDIDDNAWTVTGIIDQGNLVYQVKDPAGKDALLNEIELDPFVHFSGPQERLLAGNLDKSKHFQLRLDTLENLCRLQGSGVAGLLGPRVDLLPHQTYIANEVANRFAPRVLLADEVGLGKTIEAGLIIHSQLHNHRAERILIAVPDSLIHQWLVEMLRRFNLRFTLMDRARVEEALVDDDANPFEAAQLLLCPVSLFSENELVLSMATACDWDLLCVDEAHHLVWSPEEPSRAYQAIEQLASIARGLLLLTATPEQLGLESHFARLRLLDPDRYHSLDAFREEEAQYQPINQLIQRLMASLDSDTLADDSALQSELASYLGEQAVASLLTEIDEGADRQQLVLQKVRELLDRHGTGRVLFRNTRASVTGFPQRQLSAYPLELPAGWSDTDLHPEFDQDDAWLEEDPRVAWLMGLLKAQRREKILLITAKANTALQLEAYLTLRQGVRASVFHEGMSLVERDRSAAYFADQESGAQLLICSEIGSEGRNFQFAHHLVLFDLPINPDLLEQRIGRLDRIGQQHDVQIHVPYFEQTSQAVLLDWYHEGLNAFEQTCAIGGVVSERLADLRLQCLSDPTNLQLLDSLITETQALAEQLVANLQQGRDRLLELNSCNPESAAKTIATIEETAAELALQDYMLMAFDQFGVDNQDHSDQSWVLQPTENMHAPFPGLPEDGLSVCFNRTKALSREELAFLTWEHPMVTATLDMIASSDHGNCTLCTIKLPPLKAGSWLLEAVFVLHCPAPKSHQLSRFLPLTPIRVLLDPSNKNLAEVIAGHQLSKLTQKVPKKTAASIVKHLKGELDERVQSAKEQAEQQARGIIEKAQSELEKVQTQELDRLRALAEVNPNIRSDEIDFLQNQNQQAATYLQQTQVRLDALRVMVLT